MENMGNLGGHTPRKSRSPQSTRETLRSNSVHQNQCLNEALKKTNSTTPKLTTVKRDNMNNLDMKVEISPKTEEAKEKRPTSRKRSNSTSTIRKKADSEYVTRIPSPSHSKNSWSDRGSAGSNSSSRNSRNLKTKGKEKVDFAEYDEAVPLLYLAIYEQEQIVDLLQGMKEDLWRLRVENEGKSKQKSGEYKCGTSKEADTCPEARGCSIGEIYYNNLDEVLQVWVHLFYFIINLRINLIKAVNIAGKETFKPNTETERSVVIQAIECVKFFSKLKMKSLAESLQKFLSENDMKNNGRDIVDYGEKISTQFLLDMEFLGKKAKDVLNELKKQKR